MRNFLIAASAAAFLALPAAAQTPPPPPKLLIAISVDQFSADLFDEYRPRFTAGLARLASGSAFRNGYQSHAATETCPGHSTILTGDRPARTGIIDNAWIDQSVARPDKAIYCAEDPSAPGSTHKHYQISAMQLRVPTLGERMKARWPASRNVAVAGKDRAAVMMSGHHPDQRWFWDGKEFATDLKGAPQPASIAAINAVVAREIATAQPPLVPTSFCAAKSQPIAIAGHAPVGGGTFARAAGDYDAFEVSPEYDGAVLALSAALIREMKLGQGAAPDLISVGLSATDYIGHDLGTGGQEMCLQLLSLDRSLGDFFKFLDQSGVDYAVVLTADHGGADIPERLRLHGVPEAQRADPALDAAAVGKRIGEALKLSGPVLFGDIGGDVWLDRKLAPSDRAKALAEALRIYRAHPQVEAVFTHDQLAQTPVPAGPPDQWSLLQRARASFDAERSGDFVVILKKYVNPVAIPKGAITTHGTPWNYDRRVPILFWRKGMAPVAPETAIETADIMPTLAAEIGLTVPAGSIDGHCLAQVSGVACPAR